MQVLFRNKILWKSIRKLAFFSFCFSFCFDVAILPPPPLHFSAFSSLATAAPSTSQLGARQRNVSSVHLVLWRDIVFYQMQVVSIKWIQKANGDGGHLELLDQTKLPLVTNWIKCSHAAEVIDAIKRLAVRGAPAIGIAGAYAYCLAAQQAIDAASDTDGVVKNGKAVADSIAAQSGQIAAARPTAVNLRWAVNRMDHVLAKYCFVSSLFCSHL